MREGRRGGRGRPRRATGRHRGAPLRCSAGACGWRPPAQRSESGGARGRNRHRAPIAAQACAACGLLGTGRVARRPPAPRLRRGAKGGCLQPRRRGRSWPLRHSRGRLCTNVLPAVCRHGCCHDIKIHFKLNRRIRRALQPFLPVLDNLLGQAILRIPRANVGEMSEYIPPCCVPVSEFLAALVSLPQAHKFPARGLIWNCEAEPKSTTLLATSNTNAHAGTIADGASRGSPRSYRSPSDRSRRSNFGPIRVA